MEPNFSQMYLYVFEIAPDQLLMLTIVLGCKFEILAYYCHSLDITINNSFTYVE